VNFRSAYKRGTLERRTERRMDLKHLSEHQDYLELLQKDPAEVAALYRDLLIGVTEFFRDPEVWAHLESDVIPGMLAQRDADDMLPLKIWVPGCATGEEAYSLAMVFLEQIERLRKSTTLQIFASDVADSALGVARRGLYPADIQRTVSSERLSRFFRREGDMYEVSREVREAVTFAAHNLLADPPFSRLDLVSCRNVLIYLEEHAQHRILQLFHFALKPGGLLLLGASETVGRQGGLFRTVSKKARVYRSTATTEGARHLALNWTAGESAPTRALPGAPTPVPRGVKVSRFIEQTVLSRYTRACVVVTESFEIQSFFGPTHEYLVQPTGEARMNVLAWARPGLYPRLRVALERAVEHKERSNITDLRMERDGESRRVECSIEPITPLPGEAPLLLVAFRDIPPAPIIAETAQPQEPFVRQLEAELRHTREELQETVERLEGINEEYRAGHEELLSLNEELQSSNEELEASKEELQSLNEEMITINRQLEDKNVALQSASADINNLLVSTDIPIIFLDRELRIRRFTPAATELMHLVPSDLGRSVEHIKERFQNGGLVRDAKRVLEKLVPVTAEIETEDGRWYARNLRPYRTEDDRIDGVSMAFHDITDRKQANQKIDEARLYAEAIVATVRTPLIVLDHDLRVVSANDCFYETFEVTRPETEHMRLFDLGNRQWDIAALRNLLERVLPGDGAVENYEVRHHFEHLGPRIMHLNARLLKLNTIPPLILLAIEDVTHRATAARIVQEHADELTRESKRKDEFLAMLGHELRNPLSALMHGLDLLGLAPRDDPEQLEQVRAMMLRQARRIGSLLEQLLDIARFSTGKVRMARAPVDLTEVARTAVEAVMPRMEAQQHQLTVSMPAGESVFVLGDSPRLIQVVENLLTNAAKYTEAGGRIEFEIDPGPREVLIRVRDSGIGMSPELLPHIFELFTQEAATLERSGGGLGLGLPLVKRVVEMHGGRVEAKSPGRDQGSEFIVSLPRAPKKARVGGAAGAGKAMPRRILVVDDEEDSANALARLLAIRGHETHVAHDGPAALEAVSSFQPDVVLLDIGLPVMDGYKVARRLREENPDKSIFLVALTGYGKETDRLRESGFDRHLIKPPDMQRLYGWLARLENQGESAEV
ncbi:MAG TPA: CheR family methyltransferase, partial [Gammaproteobacteria bacterium]